MNAERRNIELGRKPSRWPSGLRLRPLSGAPAQAGIAALIDCRREDALLDV